MGVQFPASNLFLGPEGVDILRAPSTPEDQRQSYTRDAIFDFLKLSAQGAASDAVLARVNSLDASFETYLRAANGNVRTASTLYVLSAGRPPEEVPFDLESDEVRAHVHYINQTYKKNPLAIPVWDDWSHVWYDSNGGYSDFMPGVNIPRALTGLVANYSETANAFAQQREAVDDILAQGNLLIEGHHCTWLNLPLIAAFVHQELGVPLENITTILGPALTTYQQGRAVAGIGNMLKTIPDTPNGRLDDIAPALQENIRKRFGLRLARLMGTSGQVIIICPHGTSDRYSKDKVELLRPSDGTRKLIREMIEPRCHIWPIATDTRELFRWQIPSIGNMRINPGSIMPPQDEHRKPIQKLHNLVRELHSGKQVIVTREKDWVAKAA